VEIYRNILATQVPPFKVIQGHWNRRGSIAATHDFLLMFQSNNSHIFCRFRDKGRLLHLSA